MAHVDHEDDTIRRWVIWHYRFDPVRRERRNVIVAAFDNEDEFSAEFDRCSAVIRDEIAANPRSAREKVSGTVLEPGQLEAAARGRNFGRALAHGVSLDQALTLGPLPNTIGWFTFENENATPEVDGD